MRGSRGSLFGVVALLVVALSWPGSLPAQSPDSTPARVEPPDSTPARKPATHPRRVRRRRSPPPAASTAGPATHPRRGRRGRSPPPAAPPAAPAAPDSAVSLVVRSRLPGRTFRDSFSLVSAIRKGLSHPGPRTAPPDPAPGAILPERRIVAFYGNPLSARMGILGEIPPPQMLARLDEIVREWNAADSSMPALPALHLIAVTAQGKPGRDGMHRLRMDSTLIRKVYALAQEHHAILILDIQAGH